jgi:acyl-CoA synthetase (AMP-forming)/AMP-acid ligase II
VSPLPSRADTKSGPEFRPTGKPPQATFAEALRRVEASPLAGSTGARFVDRGGQEDFVPWRALITTGRRQAVALRALGIDRGDRVALFYRTEVAFLEALFTVWSAGAVPVPLYPPLRLGRRQDYELQTAAQLRAAGARLALGSARMRRLLRGTLARQPLELGALTLEELVGIEPRSELETMEERSDTDRDTDPEDLGLVQFSSGTTGRPKPVALSQRALLWQAELLGSFWPDREGVRHSGVSWLPLYHDMGLIGCVLPALLRPADLTLLAPELFVVRPATWLQAISRYRATVSPAPSFAFSYCVDKVRDQDLEGIDLSSWQTALAGAEAVAPKALRAFAERFGRYGFRKQALTPVYGLAEAALAVTFSPLDQEPRSRFFDREQLAQGIGEQAPGNGKAIELASVGAPVPGFGVEIRDDRAQPSDCGRVGRVWVRGPSLMSGYLGQPEKTAEVLVDGWLDTGDLGFFVEGELYLCGRAKDVLVLQGRNWAPEPVEEAMAELDGIEPGGVAAISVLPEGADCEELWLFAERRPGAPRAGPRAAAAGEPDRDTGLPDTGLPDTGLLDQDRIDTSSDGELIAEGRRRVLARTGLRAARIYLVALGALPRTSSGKLQRRRALDLFFADQLSLVREGFGRRAEGP